jgi:hypothetical protein
MLQVFLPPIGLQDIRTIRFTAANVSEISAGSADRFRLITWRNEDVDLPAAIGRFEQQANGFCALPLGLKGIPD